MNKECKTDSARSCNTAALSTVNVHEFTVLIFCDVTVRRMGKARGRRGGAVSQSTHSSHGKVTSNSILSYYDQMTSTNKPYLLYLALANGRCTLAKMFLIAPSENVVQFL